MLSPTDGQIITQDTVLVPGVYPLPRGLTIAANGITLNGNGALLIGTDRQGCGISIEGRHGITIRNIRLAEYQHGLVARNSQGLTISGCQITATAEPPANTEFLDIWRDADRAYGGGILLHRVTGSMIENNDLSHQMCGMYTYTCQDLTVRNNFANYCSGWGFHLHSTCDCLFEANCADYCCRWEPRGERAGHMGADAAGFLIIHASSRNVFRRNLARMGGDGFFLAGMNPQFELVGCNDNLFEQNDGSYSPNIAFEGTFSRGNIYRDNYANRCNYGFWLGFSRDGILENNQMIGNRQAGIAVENGIHFQVMRNTFQGNGHGLLLWSKRIPAFEKAVPENDTSRDWLVTENNFTGNQLAIRIAADQDHGIRPLLPGGEWGFPAPRPHDHLFRRNSYTNNTRHAEVMGADNTLFDDEG